MNKLFSTDSNNLPALFARLALAIVVFPHGAQKLLGWFGGNGFEGTMAYMTGPGGLPWIVASLVILIEFFGPILLVLGLLTRVAALGIFGLFIGIVLTAHANSGFFMNWYGAPNQPEGLEYFILLFGLAIIAIVTGGGKASMDVVLAKKVSSR